MRNGQTAVVIKTGATGIIENVESKSNGTWVTVDGKKYRDSAITVDWSKGLGQTDDGIEYGEQDLTGVVDDATEALIQQIGIAAGLIDNSEDDLSTDDEIEADGTQRVVYDGAFRIEGPAENLPPTCLCGCRAVVAKGSVYLQGHDQRHKGILIRSAVAGDESALDLLVMKGWRSRSDILARREDAAVKAAKASQPKPVKASKTKPERAMVVAS